MTLRNPPARGIGPAILKAGLLAGTLDILSAIIKYLIEGKKNPEVILKYIASAVLGKSAMKGGWDIAFLGLLLHYVIAFIFTILLFWLYPRLKLVRFNPLLIGVLYGVFAWLVMNLLVLPNTKAPQAPGPINWNQAIIGALILIAFIGIPVSLMARKYYLYKK
jgi:hypothetical protein